MKYTTFHSLYALRVQAKSRTCSTVRGTRGRRRFRIIETLGMDHPTPHLPSEFRFSSQGLTDRAPTFHSRQWGRVWWLRSSTRTRRHLIAARLGSPWILNPHCASDEKWLLNPRDSNSLYFVFFTFHYFIFYLWVGHSTDNDQIRIFKLLGFETVKKKKKERKWNAFTIQDVATCVEDFVGSRSVARSR